MEPEGHFQSGMLSLGRHDFRPEGLAMIEGAGSEMVARSFWVCRRKDMMVY